MRKHQRLQLGKENSPVLINHISEAIWPSVGAAIEHTSEARKDQLRPEIIAGLNFQIILGSACYLEGTFETLLRALLRYRSEILHRALKDETTEENNSTYLFYQRIEEDISDQIGKSNGSAGYSRAFELLAGKKLSEVEPTCRAWESITVLFHFRNVLGHGREVSALRKRYAGSLSEEFGGSYRKVQDYLHKHKLLQQKFLDAHEEYLFLGSPIADHFWEIAKQAPEGVLSTLGKKERDYCEERLRERQAPAQPEHQEHQN